MPDPDDNPTSATRHRELAILNAIAQALNATLALDQALATVLEQATALLGLDTGWVWLLNADSGAPYLAAALHLPPALADFPERMEGSCYCLDSYREGDLDGAANVNVIRCSRLRWLEGGTGGLRYHASVPINAHGRRLGLLNLAGPDWRELSPEELRLLYTVGDLLGIAVERARLFDQSAELGALRERNRLAREIHDTLAQSLAGVALQLESAESLLDQSADPDRVRRAVHTALDLTRASLEEARRSVLDLRAAPLQGRTLAEALEALASPADPAIVVDVVGGSRPLPARIEAGIYRMAQEALGNSLRHAGAGRIRLRLVTTPDRVTLAIEDDGRGMDPAAIPPDRYGLVGLGERARLLGGTLAIESGPGAGTRVEVAVPIGER